MRNHSLFFLAPLLFVLFSCDHTGGQSAASDSGSADTSGQTMAIAEETPPPCPVEAKLLPGNWIYAREKELMLAIIADSTTQSRSLGPGYRILQVYDTRSCSVVERHELPVNRSPDFAYQIARITYNNGSELVGIRAFDVIYVYDLENRSLLPPVKPQFPSRRLGVDAQSGLIQRLEVWENFLVGYAQDYGAFVFDLENRVQPKAILPIAEYRTPEDDFHTLFLLPSDGGYQALTPVYQRESDDFQINPLFSQPRRVEAGRSGPTPNPRYALLRLPDEMLAVDLLSRKLIDLPASLDKAEEPQIVDWLEEQQ